MCHMLGTEMIHFVHQMQYYITFEVRMVYCCSGAFYALFSYNRHRSSEQCSLWVIMIADTPFRVISVIKWKH